MLIIVLLLIMGLIKNGYSLKTGQVAVGCMLFATHTTRH